MADEILILDAAASNIDGTDPGSPLSIGPGTNYPLSAASFPAAPLSVQYASSVDTEGELPVSRRYSNREITLVFDIAESGANDTFLDALQAKITKLQREGGTLKRTRKDGSTIRIYDIVAADQWNPAYDDKYVLGNSPDAPVTLQARPLARGAEVDLGDNTTTTLPWLVFTEATVPGDAHGLGRLVIDNDEAATMGHLIWGVQQRNYSSASTAALYYEAESCSLISPVTAVAGPAGSSGGGSNVARHASLSSTAAPMLYLGTASTQTHIGSFRVLARVYAPNTNTGTVSVGIVWTPYSQGQAVTNTMVDIVAGGVALENQWVTVDLGMVTIPKARKGSQAWSGYLTAKSTVAGVELVYIDWIALIPVDEGSGEAYSLNPLGPYLAAASSGISVEVRHDGVLQQDAGGTTWLDPDVYEGDYLLVPPSGAEARTLRVITRFGKALPLSANRTAPASLVADVVGDVSARLFVTPRYLS